MIRRTFFRTIALAAAGFAGWLKAAPAATSLVKLRTPHLLGHTVTCPKGWTVTQRLDEVGLIVWRSTRTVTRQEYAERLGFALCDMPPPMPGFLRTIDVREDIYQRRWDVCITDREIPRGI